MPDLPHQLDIGIADVHQASPLHVAHGYSQPGIAKAPEAEMKVTAAKRRSLSPSQFAWPEAKKYPIDTAARVRAAESYLEKEHNAGKVPDSVYPKAKARIARAARHFGIESKYNERTASAAAGGAAPGGGGIKVRAHIAPGGHLHVRHLTDLGEFTACISPLKLDAKAREDVSKEGPVWIQLAKSGRFQGHSQGAFELNAKVFEEVVRNFTAVDGGMVPFDFEHASEQDPAEGDIAREGAPATGRIVGLRLMGDALFAQVEWLEPARTYIKQGRYWGVSPAIRFNAKDPVSGKPVGARLTSAALTNQPFLRGMLPIAAKDTHGEVFIAKAAENIIVLSGGMKELCYSSHESMPKVKSILRLHELAAPQECADHLEKLRDCLNAAGSAQATYQGVRLADYLMPMRDLVGATPTMTWEDILDVVAKMIDQAMDEHLAEYHSAGAEAADMTDDEGEEPEGDTTMSDANNQAIQVQLSDVTKRASTAEGKVADLTLQLRDVTARAEKAEGSLKTLEDWKTKREAQDVTDRVDLAFSDYSVERKLSDEDKEMMTLLLKNNPDGFEKRYPKKTAQQRALTQRVTPADPRTPRTQFNEHGATAEGAGDAEEATSLEELAERIMASEKCSYDTAFNKATVLFCAQ
jgi:hypothetical protein